jgi:hypothetical protein
MKQEITYAALSAIRTDLLSTLDNHPGIAILLKRKIDDFFGHNAIYLQNLDQKLSTIQHKYIEHDDKGEPIVVINGNKKEWKFLDHPIENGVPILNVDCRKCYYEEAAEFLQKSLTIEV